MAPKTFVVGSGLLTVMVIGVLAPLLSPRAEAMLCRVYVPLGTVVEFHPTAHPHIDSVLTTPIVASSTVPPFSTKWTWIVPDDADASRTTLVPETVAAFDGTKTEVVGDCTENAGSAVPANAPAAASVHTAKDSDCSS